LFLLPLRAVMSALETLPLAPVIRMVLDMAILFGQLAVENERRSVAPIGGARKSPLLAP
jgi:hypothetical protein